MLGNQRQKGIVQAGAGISQLALAMGGTNAALVDHFGQNPSLATVDDLQQAFYPFRQTIWRPGHGNIHTGKIIAGNATSQRTPSQYGEHPIN